MDYGSSLITGKIHQRFAFILGEYHVAGQTEHFKQLDCLVVHIGEDNTRAVLFSDVDYAEED